MDTTSVADFLQAKGANFITLLNDNNPDDELKGYMEKFKPALLMPTVLSFLVPLAKSGQLSIAAEQVMAHLTPKDPWVTRAIVERYLECFVDVVTE